MELFDVASLTGRARSLGDGASIVALYPTGANSTPGGLVALDLLEVEPGASTPTMQAAEEHFLYVVAGSGEVKGGAGGPVAQVRAGSFIRIAPREAHTLQSSGREALRVLVVTPLVALSDRALGLEPEAPSKVVDTTSRTEAPLERLYVAEPAVHSEPDSRREEPAVEEEKPRPDISGLMRRASELTGQPRPERRRPAPEPEPVPPPTPQAQAEPEEDEEEDARGLMELNVVFDGNSRGNPGQGYGSYLVQSPGRKPVVKRVEFGANFTKSQAEYDSLLACLQYIIERLTATNRTPDGVGLDIKTDSDLVANQLQGNYKVKDAGLRTRHAQAMQLLDQFGAWQMELQSTEETAKQLGH